MTISVLMSVYGKEQPQYLDAALRSVWDKQTLKPQQIILIEDGPLPESLASTIDDWKARLGSTLVVHQNPTNLGLTKSLNIGLQYVNSDAVARMDSDDLSAPERFALQVQFLDEHPDTDIVGGSMQEFNATEENLNVRHYPLTHAEVLRTIYKASPLAHPTVMMRTRIFAGGLRYDERFRTSQDIALWFDAICRGYKIGNVPETTLFFRRDDEVFRRRSRAKAWNEFRIYMSGVRRLYGLFSPKYIFPISRLAFRLMPVWAVKRIYGSNIRKLVVENKKPSR